MHRDDLLADLYDSMAALENQEATWAGPGQVAAVLPALIAACLNDPSKLKKKETKMTKERSAERALKSMQVILTTLGEHIESLEEAAERQRVGETKLIDEALAREAKLDTEIVQLKKDLERARGDINQYKQTAEMDSRKIKEQRQTIELLKVEAAARRFIAKKPKPRNPERVLGSIRLPKNS